MVAMVKAGRAIGVVRGRTDIVNDRKVRQELAH
jgi:hypothetical protein